MSFSKVGGYNTSPTPSLSSSHSPSESAKAEVSKSTGVVLKTLKNENENKFTSSSFPLSNKEIYELEYRVETSEEKLHKLEMHLKEANLQRKEQSNNFTFRKKCMNDSGQNFDISAPFYKFSIGEYTLSITSSSVENECNVLEDETMVAEILFQSGETTHKAVLIGIMDGHSKDKQSGKTIALFVKNFLPTFLKDRLNEFNKTTITSLGILNALKLAIVDCTYKIPEEKRKDGGCTLSAAVIFSDQMWFANLGNSRIISFKLSTKISDSSRELDSHSTAESILQVTKDQTVKKNEPSVLKRGGEIVKSSLKDYRVNGILNMRSSVGDFNIAPNMKVTSSRPTITKLDLSEMVLFLGTKALWCNASTEDVAEIVSRDLIQEKTIAESVKKTVSNATIFTEDSISAIVVSIKKRS